MAQTRGASNGESSNPTTERLASMAHDTVDRVADVANEAEREVRERAARTARQAKEMGEQAMEAADEHISKLRGYVEENPLLSAGIAFVAGMLVVSLMSKR
ncbi:MAG TPA: hypothetical protein VFO94_19245 [Gammaproteobacteria bacterium]|nr:hypothetical protein [Gammaproteobacteria bacterium]